MDDYPHCRNNLGPTGPGDENPDSQNTIWDIKLHDANWQDDGNFDWDECINYGTFTNDFPPDQGEGTMEDHNSLAGMTSPTVINTPNDRSGGSLSPSSQPSVGKPHTCNICQDSTFKDYKDLRRHNDTKHRQQGAPVYECRCGRVNPRKDNYLQHLRTCNQTSGDAYFCKCPHTCEEKEEHKAHVKGCRYGFGQIGRPRVRR
ncbi:hypothetical protein F4859DRAFT_487415 [Xylaria cf. heliscus]|nr:hypothetical protein F4859DRAFT_487415 [Xylaria cf. heliscus]